MTRQEEKEVSEFKIIVDTREQLPYKFPNAVRRTLEAGDYTVGYGREIFENEILVERKGSTSEVFLCCGKERIRFEKELEKLSKVQYKYILCEFSYMDLVNYPPPGIMSIQSVYSSVICWHIKYGIPFLFLDNRSNARAFLYKLFREFTIHSILKLK